MRLAALKKVEDELAECEKEPYGKHRGESSIIKQAAKFTNTQNAAARLKNLIYRRHALRHGSPTLKEMRVIFLNQTLVGNSNTKMRLTMHDVKMVLLEQWRYGKSERLDIWRKRDRKRMGELDRVAAIAERKRKYEEEERRNNGP